MTNQQHPITPPPELIAKWANSMCGYYGAANWGADQELDACCGWLSTYGHTYEVGLRAARRPKPPSLKEQALQAWAAVMAGTDDHADMAVIRRALEQLDD